MITPPSSALPPLAKLGPDLLHTTARQRVVSVVRPFVCAALYFVFATQGWWTAALVMIALLFVSIVATAHDLVHNSLGFPSRTNEVLLSLVGMIVLESGHAYKVTHLRHHSRFPHDDDPERESP